MMMSSTKTNNHAFQSSISSEEFYSDEIISRRPSIVPRQISFSQRRATFGEIILGILPTFVNKLTCSI